MHTLIKNNYKFDSFTTKLTVLYECRIALQIFK